MRKIIFLISFFASLIGFAQDGSLDITYNPSLSSHMYIERVMIQPDDKIIIQEKLQSIPYQTRITRLMTNGSVDLSFNCVLGINKPLNLGAIQSNGKIIIVENNVSLNNSFVYRLNPDGSLDGSFNTLNGGTGLINSVAIQPDGKILIGGSISAYNNSSVNRIVRLVSDGTVDSGFQFPTASSSVNHLTLLKNGKILINNYTFSNWNGNLIRLNSDGAIDPDFISSINCFSPRYVLQSDEKIINQDFCTDWGFDLPPFELLYRLNSDGSHDSSFRRLGFDSEGALSSLIQADDRIVVAGFFNSYDNVIVNNIIRLKSDGTLDSSFNGGDGPNDEVWDMVQQSDGKIIIVGLFYQYDNIARNHIARINSSTLSNSEFNNTDMRVYPNPVADNLYIQFPHNMSEVDIDELEVYDVTMKKIDFDRLNNDVIDVSDFSSGVYLLKVKTENSIFTSTFVKR